MLVEPQCSVRNCRHLEGVKIDGRNEATERVVCKAFPDGIPDTIAYGQNLHLKPVRGDNGIQYEKQRRQITQRAVRVRRT